MPDPVAQPPVDPWAATPATPATASDGVVIAEIAGIRITSTTVWTPVGQFPLAGSHWTVTDHWTRRDTIPRWAIVAAVLSSLVVFLFGLLFLLIRRQTVEGYVDISVSSGPWRYVARVRVSDQAEAERIHNQIAYIRSLSAL